MKGRYIAGIDLGSTKICAMVGRADREGLDIVAAATVPSQGLRKGVVIDIGETANSISAALREARSASGIDIKSAYVGISGSHIKSAESYGATGIREKEVTHADIQRVIDAASAIYVPLDREVLHVLPSEFIIDGQDGIARPLGMAGVRLEVKVQVLTASHAVLENLERSLDRAGLQAAELVFQPLASAFAALKDDELQQGAVLVDMGGGTTDAALFKGGTLRWAAVIPVGGANTTNDIAVGLKLPQKEAERLKIHYGAGTEKVNLFETQESIEARSMSGKSRQIPQPELARIIRMRLEELFELLKTDIEPQVIRHQPLCAVITGGGSQMRDIAAMAEGWLGIPVRTGLPEKVHSTVLRQTVRDPQYAAAAGLLLYGLEREGRDFSGEGRLPEALETVKKAMAGHGRALARRLLDRMRGLRAEGA